LIWASPFDSREVDLLGLGIYRAELARDAGFEKDHETVYELFCKVQMTPWCSVKPDSQYIVNPGGSANSDATVLGVRAEINF
jgi:carbohydrate-selective porin OprB